MITQIKINLAISLGLIALYSSVVCAAPPQKPSVSSNSEAEAWASTADTQEKAIYATPSPKLGVLSNSEADLVWSSTAFDTKEEIAGWQCYYRQTNSKDTIAFELDEKYLFMKLGTTIFTLNEANTANASKNKFFKRYINKNSGITAELKIRPYNYSEYRTRYDLKGELTIKKKNAKPIKIAIVAESCGI